MNRLILAGLLTLFTIGAFAQGAGISVASVTSAIKKSNKDIEHPKKQLKVKTWMKRADAFMDVQQLKSMADQPIIGAQIKKDLNKLPKDKPALKKAMTAVMKAYELDKNDPKKPGKYKDKISAMMADAEMRSNTLRKFLLAAAAKSYEAKKNDEVQYYYEQICKLNDHPICAYMDTTAYYYAGVFANEAEQYDKAAMYLKKAVDLNYKGAEGYNTWVLAAKQTKDSVNIESMLKTGVEKFPEDNQALINTLIDYYLNKKESEKALEFLNLAIKNDPTRHIYYFIKGNLFQQKGENEKAMAMYKKTVEVDPKYAAAYYAQGSLVYDQGVALHNEANAVPTSNEKKYQELLGKRDEKYKEALPFFEKAHEVDPKDPATLDALKKLYYQLKMEEKRKEIEAKIGE